MATSTCPYKLVNDFCIWKFLEDLFMLLKFTEGDEHFYVDDYTQQAKTLMAHIVEEEPLPGVNPNMYHKAYYLWCVQQTEEEWIHFLSTIMDRMREIESAPQNTSTDDDMDEDDANNDNDEDNDE